MISSATSFFGEDALVLCSFPTKDILSMLSYLFSSQSVARKSRMWAPMIASLSAFCPGTSHCIGVVPRQQPHAPCRCCPQRTRPLPLTRIVFEVTQQSDTSAHHILARNVDTLYANPVGPSRDMIDSSCKEISTPGRRVTGMPLRWTQCVFWSLCMDNNAAVVTEDGAQVKDTSHSLREIHGDASPVVRPLPKDTPATMGP